MLDEHYLSQFPAHRSRLVRAAARLLGNTAEAEDAVQDTYLRALEADTSAGVAAAQAWLTAVMQHIAIDRLRRRSWMQRWLHDAQTSAPLPESPSTEDRAALAEEVELALRLLATRLGPADGAAVLLREVFEASFKEIAHASAKTEAACRQQLHRALLRLRLRLRQDDGKNGGEGSPDTLFHAYRQALLDGDARVLWAMLRQPPARALAVSAAMAPRPEAARVLCQVVQVGGRLGLVLTLGGKVLCVVPLDARHAEATSSSP